MNNDIQIELRVKNALLLDAIEDRWGKVIDQVWNANAKRSARPLLKVSAEIIGINPNALGDLLGMRIRAYKKCGEPRPITLKVAEALGEPVESLFPPETCSSNVPITKFRISSERLLSLSAMNERAAIAPSPDERELTPKEKVGKLIEAAGLTSREKLVILGRFGLDGEKQTIQDLADNCVLSCGTIRQIEAKAIRKMRGLETLFRYRH